MVKITGNVVDARAGLVEIETKDSAEVFIEERAQAGPDAPDILYHYTSAQGLIDILQSWEIWSTSITHLNDASEYVHTLKLADRLPSNALVNSHWNLDRFLADCIQNPGHRPPVYVASFSGDGNLLSQWRAYCPPGNGYSIGFSRERLRKCAHDQTEGLFGAVGYEHYDRWRLLRCEYDTKEQERVLREIISDVHRTVESMAEADRNTLYGFLQGYSGDFGIDTLERQPKPMGILQHDYILKVEKVAPAFKDSAFQEEKEWRIVSPRVLDRGPKFRAGRFSVIPYVPFKLPLIDGKRHVDRIVIGPTENPKLARDTIELMSESKDWGFTVSSIVDSQVPFRHWDSRG